MKTDINRSARWFCGSLYTNVREPDQDIKEVWKLDPNIIYVKYQLEKGEHGNLHYQFVLKVETPVRRSALFKSLKMVKGEWIEPVYKINAQLNYCEKDRTRVDGPWEYSKFTKQNFHCKVCQKDPNFLFRLESLGKEKELIKHYLEHKMLEIEMWMDYQNKKE